MGVLKKIRLGFIAIGLILLLSGAVVIFEMSRVTSSVAGLLSDNVKSIDATKSMQRFLYSHNSAIFKFLSNNEPFNQDSIHAELLLLEEKLNIASTNITIEGEDRQIAILDSLYQQYSQILKELPILVVSPDSVNQSWYLNRYRSVFTSMYEVTDKIMDMNQEVLEQNSIRLENDYYRMIIPAIIAILAAILMIVLFSYFINQYFIKPILMMLNAISGFLASGIPYVVKLEVDDEIGSLNNNIKELVERAKKK